MSRFDVLSKRAAPTKTEPEKVAGSRRSNPTYRQFSAYIPADLYRKVKVQLAERDLDLSEAVELALAEWLQKETTSK